MCRNLLACALPLLACGVVSSTAWGQASPKGHSPSFSKSNPVDSPNRTPFASLAATSRTPVGPATSTSGISVVDSTGKTIGRYMSGVGGNGGEILTSYNNQLIQIMGLDNDYDPQTNRIRSGGLNFTLRPGTNSGQFPVVYTSSDCSGTSYSGLSYFTGGTRYTAIPVTDTWPPTSSAAMYLLVFDTAHPINLSVNSVFDQGQCFVYSFTQTVAKALGAVPASTIGNPPYYLK